MYALGMPANLRRCCGLDKRDVHSLGCKQFFEHLRCSLKTPTPL